MTRTDQMQLFIKVVDELGQSKVAEALGCSPATVCTISKGTYPNPTRWLERCEEVFGSTMIDCPVLGCEISLGRCADERRKLPRYTNPMARLLTETCPTCKNRR